MADYTPEEYTDMIIAYGLAGENTCAAERLYAERFPKRDRHPTSRTIYNAVRRARHTGSVMPYREHEEGLSSFNKAMHVRILRTVQQNEGKSLRSIARMLKVSPSLVSRVIRRGDSSDASSSEISTDEELEQIPKRKLRKQRKQVLKGDNLFQEHTGCVHALGSRRSKITTGVRNSDIISHAIDLEGPENNLPGIKVEDNNRIWQSHVLENAKQESTTPGGNQSINNVLNATAEFCNTSVDTLTHEIIEKKEENEQKLTEFEFVGIKDTQDGTVFLDEFKTEPVTMGTTITFTGLFYG